MQEKKKFFNKLLKFFFFNKKIGFKINIFILKIKEKYSNIWIS